MKSHEIALNFHFHRKVKAGHDFEYNTPFEEIAFNFLSR